MQIDKRIRLEKHYRLLNMGLQIQRRINARLHQGKTINVEIVQEDSVKRRVHLRSHRGKTKNSENNTRRFRNFEQFTRSVRSIQSSMVDTYANGNFNQRN